MDDNSERALPVKTKIEVPELSPEQREKLWDAVIAAVRAEDGAHYDQTIWTQDGRDRPSGIYTFAGSCGTVACIAGHAVHEAVRLEILPPFRHGNLIFDGLLEPACKLLGLSAEAGEILFGGSFEPCDGYGIDSVLEELRERQKMTGLDDAGQASFLESMTESDDDEEDDDDSELEDEDQ